MQSNFAKIAVVVVAIAAVIVLFVVLGGDDDSGDSTTTRSATTTTAEQAGGGQSQKPEEAGGEEVPRITIVNGEPEGGVQDLEFTVGDEVKFEVLADEDLEIHVHGYDIPTEVQANKVATISFPADIDGVFEVEIEETATQVAELTVNPG